MIITETISENRIRYYSDNDMMLRQIETGTLYEDAAHDLPCIFTYEETDIPIEHNDDEPTSEDYEHALTQFGVNFNGGE